jgi:hypothetical protein
MMSEQLAAEAVKSRRMLELYEEAFRKIKEATGVRWDLYHEPHLCLCWRRTYSSVDRPHVSLAVTSTRLFKRWCRKTSSRPT